MEDAAEDETAVLHAVVVEVETAAHREEAAEVETAVIREVVVEAGMVALREEAAEDAVVNRVNKLVRLRFLLEKSNGQLLFRMDHVGRGRRDHYCTPFELSPFCVVCHKI